MEKRNALLALLCTAALFGCDGETTVDAGADASVILMDGGNDDGGSDGGGSDDGGSDDGGSDDGGSDDGGNDDGGSDAGADAGCITTCGPTDCGMIDDGCGGSVDCGLCAAGTPCTDGADCADGVCITEANSGWTAGYCSGQCWEDSDCAGGTHCGYISDTVTRLGVCVVDCTSDADCRSPDYTCHQADDDGPMECAAVASGMGALGDRCTSHADCAGGEDGFCAVEANGWREGFCSMTCLVDVDCGTGAHCGNIPAGGGEGICLLDCSMDSDCRMDGYACINGDEDGGMVDECWPAGTGMGAPGDACTGVWDCAGREEAFCLGDDAGFLDGYCAVDACVSDADCATGSHCTIFLDAMGLPNPDGVCLDNCTSDADCRAMGYACDELGNDNDTVNECWPAGTGTAPVGAPCEGVWECSGGTRAICASRPGSDFADGMCLLAECTDGGVGPTGCPAGTHCSIDRDAGGMPETSGFCLLDCVSDLDCRGGTNGYSCQERGDVDLLDECWPAATGTGLVGDACRWLSDCAGGENGACLIDNDASGTETRGDTVGGYCTLFCGAGGTTCPGGTTCQLGTGVFCTRDCAVPLDCPRDEYTCTMPPFGGVIRTACWTDIP